MNNKASLRKSNHGAFMINHGVYIVKDLDALDSQLTDPANKDHYYIKYIGSTTFSLDKLEYNHREETHFYNPKTGKKDVEVTLTDFRKALRDRGQRWVFEWLIEPRETNEYSILIDEGIMIRHYKPALNKNNTWGQNPLIPRLKDINDREYIS